MTNQELLSSIQALPPSQQLELANTILDRLAESGTWPISEEMKQLLIDVPKMQTTTRMAFARQKKYSLSFARN